MNHSPVFQNTKKVLHFAFAIFLFAVSPAPSPAQEGTAGPSPPFVPIAELGECKPIVEKLQTALKEGNLFEFYETCKTFSNEQRKSLNADGRVEAKTREEAMAQEWIYYFVVTAPIIPMDVYVRKALSTKEKIWPTDLHAKNAARIAFTSDFWDENGGVERRKRSYKRQYGTDATPLFTPEEYQKLQIAHLDYYAALLKSYPVINEAARVAKENLRTAPVPDYVEKNYVEPKFPRHDLKLSGEENFELRRKYYEEVKKHPDPADLWRVAANSRLSSILSAFSPRPIGLQNGLIEKTIRCFPRDAAKVREYLKKAGYSSDLECAEALAAAFVRTKETAYLFQGLPDEKEVTDYKAYKNEALWEISGMAHARNDKFPSKVQEERRRYHNLASLPIEERLAEELTAKTDEKLRKSAQLVLERRQRLRVYYEKQLAEEAKTDAPAVRLAKLKAEQPIFKGALERAQRKVKYTVDEKELLQARKFLTLVLAETKLLETEIAKANAAIAKSK